MSLIDRAALAVLHRFDAERAHDLAIAALRSGLVPPARMPDRPRLRVRLAGLDLPNPVGLAAGFDKNARVLPGLARAGFGFVEAGGVTPRPQGGNPRPRVWRLKPERGVINALGLNNDGADVVAARLAARPAGAIVGLNVGVNKDSPDRAADYVTVLRRCGPHIDFATVNVSSPNTERLRDLQGAEALAALLAGVTAARNSLPHPIPVFLKIAPDLEPGALAEIAAVAVEAGVDGIVATNTTVSREGLVNPLVARPGGLSGRPLFASSTRVLARLSALTSGQLPLIGVGGVEDGATAYAKIRAGASAVQLYTALIYGGFSLVGRICAELDALLARDGFDSIAQAVGSDREAWLED